MNELRGFQLLNLNQKGMMDLEKYESIINCPLPPLFSKFCQSFGLENCFDVPKFYHPEYEQLYFAGDLKLTQFENRPIDFSGFDSLEEIFENWKDKKQENDWLKNHFIRLASISIGGGIYLGTKEETQDKIYLIVWDWEEEYIEIADDIFSFVNNGLMFQKNEDSLYGYSYSQLYKNWGENFWRVIDIKS